MTVYNDADLGWSAPYLSQLSIDELDVLTPARIAAVHRNAVDGLTRSGPLRLTLPPGLPAGQVAVGDWGLSDGARLTRLLDRQSLLKRRAADTGRSEQLIAANLDTLFLVTSCNADFNVARLERYLVLAAEAGISPVIVLTKADLGDPAGFVAQASRAAPGTPVEALDARDAQAAACLVDWLGKGRTGALLGSSGVGKSTLLNAMAGQEEATQGIREDDAKGRHTTTARHLFPGPQGSWLIDTPGMRELRLTDVEQGIDAVFSDIAELARHCRFHDCAHETEPGCAIRAAIETGDLDPARLKRWQKLQREEAHNSASIAEARAYDKARQKMYSQGKARSRHKRRT